MKTIWLVGGGFESVPGIERARAMGLRVAVSDADPRAPGLALADHPAVASTYDPDATLEAIRRHLASRGPVHGVTCVAADVPLTVAHCARALGLPGIPVRSARLSMDKLAMKDVLRAHGVAVPEYAPLSGPDELVRWLDRFERLVIKPVDSRGARGVLQLDRQLDLEWAFEESRRHSPSGRVMVEEYVEGPQVSTEGLLVGGRCHPIALNDRNYDELERFRPFIIENGGSHPSFLPVRDQESLAGLALEAGRALGVSDGVVKGDLVLSPEGPKVIEVALRLSGGFFCTHQIPLATGVDLVGASLRMAVGEPVDEAALAPRLRRGVAIRYAFPRAGCVRRIRGVEEVESRPGIEWVRMAARPGDRVGDPRNHTERAGCVLATGADATEAIARAEGAIRDLSIETGPASSASGIDPGSARVET